MQARRFRLRRQARRFAADAMRMPTYRRATPLPLIRRPASPVLSANYFSRRVAPRVRPAAISHDEMRRDDDFDREPPREMPPCFACFRYGADAALCHVPASGARSSYRHNSRRWPPIGRRRSSPRRQNVPPIRLLFSHDDDFGLVLKATLIAYFAAHAAPIFLSAH